MFWGSRNNKRDFIKRLEAIRSDSIKHGVSAEQFRKIFSKDLNDSSTDGKTGSGVRPAHSRSRKLIAGVILTAAVAFVLAYHYEIRSYSDIKLTLGSSPCFVHNNELVIEMCRPRINCRMCENLHEVPVETNITQELFRELYAYTAVPVLIKNATRDWTAMSNFSFQFFKDLYQNTEGALQSVDEECQFFPYKTDFESLGEVFNMTDDRANFKEGEKSWYIGWSNCHPQVQKKLRQHYRKPYFLPNDSESSFLDWMFMGGSGPGAFIHIDFVQRPSWQAQIVGKKTWRLIPSPECEHVCSEMNVTVHKGDIIVVDTNKWFHSTFIHPGEISITIGSEYD